MARTPEGKVKDAVVKLFKKRGVHYFMPVQAGFGAPHLDFICCHYGYFFAVETKAPGKKATPRQILTMRQVEDAGGLTMVIDDRDAATMQPLADLLTMLEVRDVTCKNP
jgi:hypothetical protein